MNTKFLSMRISPFFLTLLFVVLSLVIGYSVGSFFSQLGSMYRYNRVYLQSLTLLSRELKEVHTETELNRIIKKLDCVIDSLDVKRRPHEVERAMQKCFNPEPIDTNDDKTHDTGDIP